MASQLTLENYPQTAEGHRRLLSRARALEAHSKSGWHHFYEEVRGGHQRWADFQDIVGPAPLPGSPQPSPEDALKRLQQALEQMGRMSQCSICFSRVDAAELTPEHPHFMKILTCGHVLCGGCGHAMKERPDNRCPCCRQDMGKQLLDCRESKAEAVSRKRARQEISDLLPVADPDVHQAGCFASRFKGSCFLCDVSWNRGAFVTNHARLSKKVVCPGCKEAAMPCCFCGGDASQSAVLKNGKGETKKFFCLDCVKNKSSDELRGIVNVKAFLGKHL